MQSFDIFTNYICTYIICTVSQKIDTDVAHYNFDTNQPILNILIEIFLREYAIKW